MPSATTGTARSRPASPSTTAGTSGSSSRCWSAAWPTARRRWSTGARSAPPCWPTSRWWTAAAGGTKPRPSSSASWSSGSSRSPTTPTSCSPTSTKLEGGWPERVLDHAAQLDRPLGRRGGGFPLWPGSGQPIRVFTTRVDTIFGATCVILAPEHPLTAELVSVEDQAAGQSDDRRPARTRTRATWRRKASSPATTPINPYNGEQDPGLGGQLRADGVRHGRDHGGAGARPARLRVLPQVRHPGAAGDPAGGRNASPQESTHAEGVLRRRRSSRIPASSRAWRARRRAGG